MFKDYYKEFKLKNVQKLSGARIGAITEAVLSEAEGNAMKDITKKRFLKKAVIIPAAAALAAVAVTASAASFGLFDSFSRFFAQMEGSNAPGKVLEENIVKHEEVYELDDYNVMINGFYCDKNVILVSYDVEYKSDMCFENGELLPLFASHTSPATFYLDDRSGGWGTTRNVSRDGNTVSYVAVWFTSGGFYSSGSTEFDLDLDMMLHNAADFRDLDTVFSDPDHELPAFSLTEKHLKKTVPVGKEINVKADKDLQFDNKSMHLDSITAGTLSVSFSFSGTFNGNYAVYKAPFSLTLKDGTVIEKAEDKYMNAFDNESSTAVFMLNTVIDPNDITEIKYANCTVTLDNGEVTGMTVDPV